MKKAVLLLLTAVFLTTPVLLFAQKAKEKSKKTRATQEEEYNQSKIGRLKIQQLARIQQIMLMNGGQQRAQKMDLNPGGLGNKGVFNTTTFRSGFGISSFFNHRLKPDMYLVGEIGFFYTSSQPYRSPLDRAIYEQVYGSLKNSDVFEAMLIPLYAGIRKGFSLSNKMKRFYPYVGAGAGPVLGTDYIRQNQVTQRTFQVAPSAYALIGTEIYTNNSLFFDLSFRYRYMAFNKILLNRKNFSGFSIGLGFGYGFGQQLLR